MPGGRTGQAGGEDQLVGLGRGLDAIGLDTHIQVANHLAEVAQIGRIGLGQGRLGAISLINVDHQHLALVAPAAHIGLGAAKQLGGRRGEVQPRAVAVDHQIVDAAGD